MARLYDDVTARAEMAKKLRKLADDIEAEDSRIVSISWTTEPIRSEPVYSAWSGAIVTHARIIGYLSNILFEETER